MAIGRAVQLNNVPTKTVSEIVRHIVNSPDKPKKSDEICKLLYYEHRGALNEKITPIQKEELVTATDVNISDSKQRIFKFPKGENFKKVETAEIRVFTSGVRFDGSSKLMGTLEITVEVIVHFNLEQLEDGFNIRDDKIACNVMDILNGLSLGNFGELECRTGMNRWTIKNGQYVGYFMNFDCGKVMLQTGSCQ